MESTHHPFGQHASFSEPDNQAFGHNIVDSGETAQDETPLEETTAWIPKMPATSKVRAVILRKPVVIPRIDTVGRLSISLPFMRVYSEDLRPHGIDDREFVGFIDNLSVAQAAPVPLQALNKAGSVIGFVPSHWAMAAGAGINLTAGVGTAAFSTVRTRRFMEKVNREYFAPRGLKASIYKNQQLVEKLDCDTILPLLEPLNPESNHTSMRDRRMQALAPYVAPLTLNVPPPTKQRNVLDKMSAKQIERSRQKQEKGQQKKDGYSSDTGSGSSLSSDSSSSSDSSLEGMEKKIRSADARIDRINRKAELDMLSKDPRAAAKVEEKRTKQIRKVEKKRAENSRKVERRNLKVDKKRNSKSEKDIKKIARMEFLVIENLDAIQ